MAAVVAPFRRRPALPQPVANDVVRSIVSNSSIGIIHEVVCEGLARLDLRACAALHENHFPMLKIGGELDG